MPDFAIIFAFLHHAKIKEGILFDQIIVIYCICDEVFKALNVSEDLQSKMSNAEVVTFALLSSLYYGGNYQKTRMIAKYHGYFHSMLSLSRMNRRIHSLPEHIWMLIFQALQLILKNPNNKSFIIDSFPVKAYENHKIFRAKIFSDKRFHGYTASKKSFFSGIKVNMVVDKDGVPIEFSFTPGGSSDCTNMQDLSLQLPEHSLLLGDAAYTCYEFEDLLAETEMIDLLVKRKANLKRQNKPTENFLLSRNRNIIETVFSSITSRMPRYIKARTEKGFCLKIFFFILAYMVNLYFPVS